jgi:hypothetical protein
MGLGVDPDRDDRTPLSLVSVPLQRARSEEDRKFISLLYSRCPDREKDGGAAKMIDSRQFVGPGILITSHHSREEAQ